jgi:two-component system OmpR family response regulator/two-component system alkaline phosphatase synthesis response regulator PhoP
MKRLLVVEDELDINEMIVLHLRNAGYEVEATIDGEQALKVLNSKDVSLIVLDVLLPGMSGWQVCEQIRSNRATEHIPIIFLTALSAETDRVRGFDLGGDDYVNKPFSPRELVSRVRALLRRVEQENGQTSFIRIGDLGIDFLKHRIEVRGRQVHLTNSEFQLLNLLARNRGKVYSRDELLTSIRDNGVDLELGNIDVHVHNLRHKIEENPRDPAYIQTVWGVGYRFVET